MPRIYGSPKIHKEGIPLRPIVNTIGSPTYHLAKFLAKRLRPLSGNTSSYVKDPSSFVKWIKNQKIKREDLKVRFDIVSLYIKILVDEAIEVIKNITDEVKSSLITLCLKSTYFNYVGVIYEQTHGVAMGSPLSPAVANIYMEHFEIRSLICLSSTPGEWKRYVDDIFSKCGHGKEKLNNFLAHLNSLSEHINFTLEMEKNNQLPFLDVLLTKKEDESCGYQVYRKKTHMDRYLHADSHHHPN